MKHRQFTEDFKRDLVNKAMLAGAVKSHVAKEAGISNNLLHNWINKAAKSTDMHAMPGTRADKSAGSADATGSTQRKKMGRPFGSRNKPKNEAADTTAAPRSRIGRPRGSRNKVSSAQPIEAQGQGAAQTPKKRGRPRKADAASVIATKKPGRPRKEAAVAMVEKRRPGRPRKDASTQNGDVQAKKLGRPAKMATQAGEKRKPGRPRKNAAVANQPKKLGRPAKQSMMATQNASGTASNQKGISAQMKTIRTEIAVLEKMLNFYKKQGTRQSVSA